MTHPVLFGIEPGLGTEFLSRFARQNQARLTTKIFFSVTERDRSLDLWPCSLVNTTASPLLLHCFFYKYPKQPYSVTAQPTFHHQQQ